MSQSSSPKDKYWSIPQAELLEDLESSDRGLSPDEAAARLARYGPNLLKAKEQSTAFGIFIRQFKNPIIIILLVATIVSGIVQDWLDAGIILLIVIASALLSTFQEHRASQAAEKLRAQVTIKSVVLRSDQTQSIPSSDIVPGDVILLSAGSLIPADGVLLQADDFFVNQAVLTGETYPVEKRPGTTAADSSLTDRSNTVYMGTNVRSGSARMLVVLTGTATAFGQIANRLSLRPPETEFERGIRRLGYLLTEVTLLLVLGIFAINVAQQKPFLDSLLFSVALAVGLTPQLLPAVININLSKGSQAMAKRGVIVRRLEAIENFGSMDVLCTDKTGTLTLGIVQLTGAFDWQGKPSDQVYRYARLNARFQTGLGNPLDEAILGFRQVDEEQVLKLEEIPYDFVRKRLSVAIAEGDHGLLITKGAFDNVLAACTSVLHDQQTVPLGPTETDELDTRFHEWSDQGDRVLGVAIKTIPREVTVLDKSEENNLTFAGFLRFSDLPKPGVEETIRRLAELGVALKIITGDNQYVARHIAEQVGISNAAILTGGELDKLRDEALWHTAERTDIFAEVDPNQKERIILALKKTGHVVGYMGDGINDAPSLHSADVGISVENAVDVAKEAADFVLLKQDLDVLREGIEEGRKTFANTLKYVFMATSANFGNMFSVAGISLILPFIPMLPVQILLINFLTDLPELTIATDNVDAVFIQKPHRWDVGFIRSFMLIFGPLSSVFDFLTFGVLLLYFKSGQSLFQTGWFVESIISASFVVFAIRTRLPFWKSKPSRAMLLVTGIVALITLYLPYSPLAKPLGFQPLPPIYLLFLGVIVGVYFCSTEITKRWFYRRHPN